MLPISRNSRPCEGCLDHGDQCIVVKGKKVCTSCKRRKRKCSIKGVVNRLIATGQLGSVEESMSLEITSKEDIIALGLDRGSEVVLLQLLSFQQRMDERLGELEERLRRMEKGKAREEEDIGGSVDEDSGDGGDIGSSDGEMHDEWMAEG